MWCSSVPYRLKLTLRNCGSIPCGSEHYGKVLQQCPQTTRDAIGADARGHAPTPEAGNAPSGSCARDQAARPVLRMTA